MTTVMIIISIIGQQGGKMSLGTNGRIWKVRKYGLIRVFGITYDRILRCQILLFLLFIISMVRCWFLLANSSLSIRGMGVTDFLFKIGLIVNVFENRMFKFQQYFIFFVPFIIIIIIIILGTKSNPIKLENSDGTVLVLEAKD